MKELLNLKNLKQFIKTKKYRNRLKAKKPTERDRLKTVTELLSEMYSVSVLDLDIPLESVHYLVYGLLTDKHCYIEEEAIDKITEAVRQFIDVDLTIELSPNSIKNESLAFDQLTPIDITYFEESLPFGIGEFDEWKLKERSNENANVFKFYNLTNPEQELCVELPETTCTLTTRKYIQSETYRVTIDPTCFHLDLTFIDLNTPEAENVHFHLYYRYYKGRFEKGAFLDNYFEQVTETSFNKLGISIPISPSLALIKDFKIYSETDESKSQEFELDTAALVNLTGPVQLMNIEAGYAYSYLTDFYIENADDSNDELTTDITFLDDKSFEELTVDQVLNGNYQRVSKTSIDAAVNLLAEHLEPAQPDKAKLPDPVGFWKDVKSQAKNSDTREIFLKTADAPDLF